MSLKPSKKSDANKAWMKKRRDKEIPIQAEYADNTDPFYSENNIRYLEQKAADYKANRLCLSEHQLIEDEE